MKFNFSYKEDIVRSCFIRHDLINYLINLYGYKSYLEIGIQTGANFILVDCEKKIGVDPSPLYEYGYLTQDMSIHKMTSDNYFDQNLDNFDLIFIDGLHVKEQVLKDIENSFKFLNPKGTIVLHDCLPYSEDSQSPIEYKVPIWNGNVWEAFAHLRQYKNLFMMTINTDWGLGVIKKGNQIPYQLPEKVNYDFFVENKEQLMNIITCENGLKVIQELHKNGL